MRIDSLITRKLVGSVAAFVIALYSTHVLAKVDTLKVYAASSLTQVVNELSEQYEAISGTKVEAVYASSSQLARQIAYGAPADIYIAANQRWVDYLIEQDVSIVNNPINLASNTLVIVASNDSPMLKSGHSFDVSALDDWVQWLGNERLAIGNVNHVPVGIYAQQSLTNLALWGKLKNQTAPMNNARMVLTMVEKQSTPLGIVYYSDAISSDHVSIVGQLPSKTHDKVVYPIVNLKSSDESILWIEFLHSSHAMKTWKKFGFITP